MGHQQATNVRLLRDAMKGEILPFGTHMAGCPKCSAQNHATIYCVGVMTQPECEHENPHLHRACGNCQFMWTEHTLDDPSTSVLMKMRVNPGRILAAILYGLGGSFEFDPDATEAGGNVIAVQKDNGMIDVRLEKPS